MEKEIKYRGISFLSLLGIVFIVLKLVGTINWSWWWVLAPLWGQMILYMLFLVIWIIIIIHTKY